MKRTAIRRDPEKIRDWLNRHRKPLPRGGRLRPRGKRAKRDRKTGRVFGPLAAMVRMLNCDLCGHPGPSDPHHVRPRGAGFGDWLPTGEGNLTALCRHCHQYVEDHPLYKRDELIARAVEHGEAFKDIEGPRVRRGLETEAGGMSTPRFYTTKIEAAKTASQIGDLLRKYGAKRYSLEFDDEGDPTALTFSMAVPALGIEVPVRLLAQTEALTKRLNGNEVQAWRVAWRQLYAWVEMCMEMVENGVKPFHEVFMADVLMEGGVRLVERFEEEAGRLLPSPESPKVIALPSGTHD